VWSATEPDSALTLFDSWRDLLPPFIHDNVLDQLIIPKIQKAVSEWNPKIAAQSLQAIVFPWLSHVGLRMEDLVGDAKRKVRSNLRGWKVGDGVPKDLIPWKDVSTLVSVCAYMFVFRTPRMYWAILHVDMRPSCHTAIVYYHLIYPSALLSP
jgi:tuftelin-interacting protein 11